MKAYVIVIGDEILLGRVTDTNSGDIARSLDPLGIPVVGVDVVGDVAADITAAVHRAMDAADIVITTGGLGPTKDDITKAALMSIFGGKLRHDPEVTANIHRIFAAKGRKINALTENQALVPDTCTVIQNIWNGARNDVGTRRSRPGGNAGRTLGDSRNVEPCSDTDDRRTFSRR